MFSSLLICTGVWAPSGSLTKCSDSSLGIWFEVRFVIAISGALEGRVAAGTTSVAVMLEPAVPVVTTAVIKSVACPLFVITGGPEALGAKPKTTAPLV